MFFFRAVSHQLFGTGEYHLKVRAQGIEHMRQHPQCFIESNTENSWLQYLNNMSRQGTWCDNLVIQAVSNALNCVIHITERAANFAETTIIHPANTVGKTRTIYLGHIDEIHYVSTMPVESEPSNMNSERPFLLQATNLNIELPMQNVFSRKHYFWCNVNKTKSV